MKPQVFDPASIPLSVSTDSYKQSHFEQYPEARFMSAYTEARGPLRAGDDRIVTYGARYFVERWLMRQWTLDDVAAAGDLFCDFNAGGTHHPFPKDLFIKFIEENNGYFPIRVRALPDGTACYYHTPQMIFEAEGEYSRLVTWLESVALQSVWYMSTVATISRSVVTEIGEAFEKSVDPDAFWKLSSRFHDFGLRGCTSTEQAIMGGTAHLLSSDGTDNCPAAYYAKRLNNGKAVGSSIPATEHSVMTAYVDEADAVRMMVDNYGNGVFATVADSYDYQNFLDNIVPLVAKTVQEKGGFHVVRPDSGDPVGCVVNGLIALEKAYGADTNGKGYRVIRNAGIIQGDGINPTNITQILEAVMDAGFSAENVAFGMGGGLLQKVNRDTLKYATKLSYRVDSDGIAHDVMKDPKTDPSKRSLPGEIDVISVDGVPTAVPKDPSNVSLMITLWDSGLPDDLDFESFDAVRSRLDESWESLPERGIGISSELRAKQDLLSR